MSDKVMGDKKNKLKDNFGIIDLDNTDTIPQITSDDEILSKNELIEYSEDYSDEYMDENIEEIIDENIDENDSGDFGINEYEEEYEDEYTDQYSDEDYGDEYGDIENGNVANITRKSSNKAYDSEIEIDEEKYSDNEFDGEILYEDESLKDDVYEEEAEETFEEEIYEEEEAEEVLEEDVYEEEVEETLDEEVYEEVYEEELKESFEEVYGENEEEYRNVVVTGDNSFRKTNKPTKPDKKKEPEKGTNKGTNKEPKKESNKEPKKDISKNGKTNSKNKAIAKTKDSKKNPISAIISKMGPAEWGLAIGALIAIIMIIVVVTVLVKRSGANKKFDPELIKPVGSELAGLGIAGNDGLNALYNLTPKVDDYDEEEEEEKEPSDVITVSFTSIEKDLKIKFVNTGTERLVTGIEFKVTLTSPKGKETVYSDSDLDGIIYETGLDAGDYTVSIETVDGYEYEAFDSVINVKDKIVYKQVDVTKEIKKESEVNVAQEDTAKNNVQAEEATNYSKDTVEWVESTKTPIDGDGGYTKIDKSSIPEPSYALRNAISVVMEVNAANGASSLQKWRIGVITREPEDGEPADDKKEEDKTASISFGGNKNLNVDSKITLKPVAEYDGNSLPDSGFKDYSSSDSSVASVDSDGKVTGKSEGEATIKVKYECSITEDGKTINYKGEGSVKITVKKEEITVTGIEVDKSSISLTPNATATIEAKAKMSDDSTVTSGFVFTSSDENIVKVDKSSGKVTAVAKGEAKITVSYTDSNDNKKETKVTVTVSDLTAKELKLSKDSTSLAVGKTETIAPTVTLSDDSKITDNAKFTYSSADEKIAKVNSDGVITAVKKGEVEITVKYGEGDKAKSAVIKVKVVEDAASDTTSKLKDKNGKQVYIKNSEGKYVEATYADYYKSDEFYVEGGSGYKYTGWQTIDSNVYYYDKNGNKVTGEQIIQGVTYKFTDDGILKMDNGGVIGIDVSKWNGTIDWNAVKNAGVSFVIIRCGYRGSTSGALIEDSKFKSNIKGAQAAGLKVGIYFFTQATNEVEAVEEASMVISLVQGYSISYPIFIDTEQSGGRGDKIDKSTRTAVCVAFCETIKNAGYTPGVYASKSWYNDNLSYGSIAGYRIWLAQYASQPSFSGRYDIWQHTEKGTVNGISGKVDLNISYMGY